MKSSTRLLLLLLALLLPACAGAGGHKVFAGPTLTLNYDDFGPESAASRFLGPRGSHTVIIAHFGYNHITPSAPEDDRYVNVLQSMNFLRDEVRSLPHTSANEPLRQRLRDTYARLYPLQRMRYNAQLNASFAFPVGGMDRRLMLPALPPPAI
ncbi:MAG: hypothetical protein B7Z37_01070 [Verrucomicrobia bacterium 12-59-8]|nr:MAG: hypothetical protein B7Z37_01070 [Verrucomicrobia bacterium 12-59-8]